MSANSSSSLELPQRFSSICFGHREANIIFASFTVTNIVLLLPLCTTILSLGCQRWRRQRSASTSHSDIITYHMVVMEMICVFGSISYCIGVGFNLKRMMVVACYVILITVCGQISFHVLTCVERYLAVVHPVTYMHLRRDSGVTIRNISIWCVWLLGCAEVGLMAEKTIYAIFVVYFMHQVFSLVVVSFCSLSVLAVLKRPGPAGRDGDRSRVDKSKQRAFYTITAIFGSLLLRFVGSIVCAGLYSSSLISNSDRCVVAESSYFFGLPSSLVLPLLFLHRAGKLPCCKTNTAE
ncbi:uncharacterized protein LOC144459926 [Epinephelus lanceolatus]